MSENRLLSYLEKTHQVQMQIGLMPGQIVCCSVKLSGKKISVDKIYPDLLGLLLCVRDRFSSLGHRQTDSF